MTNLSDLMWYDCDYDSGLERRQRARKQTIHLMHVDEEWPVRMYHTVVTN